MSTRHSAQEGVIFQYPVAHHGGGPYLPHAADKGGSNGWLYPLRNAKNGVARSHAQTTKMAFDRDKQANEQKKAKENHGNADQKMRSAAQGRMDSLRSILMQYAPVRSSAQAKPDALAKRDYVAETLADQLNDRQSLGCYRQLAAKIPPTVLFTTLATVKEQAKDGTIRTRPGAVFVDQIKRYAAAKKIALDFTRGGEATA